MGPDAEQPIKNTAGEARIELELLPDKELGKGDKTTLRATVRDQNGALLPAATVNFAAADGRVTISPASGSTGPSGALDVTLEGRTNSKGTTSVEATVADAANTVRVRVPDGSVFLWAVVTLVLLWFSSRAGSGQKGNA